MTTKFREALPLVATIILSCAALAACESQPSHSADTGSVDVDGLQSVRSRSFSAASLRPGVDFTHYRGVLINDVELAFRTPDRTENQFPLDEQQKKRFREYLRDQFVSEFANLKNLRLASAAGPDVLELNVRVQDIVATVPPTSIGNIGRASFALEAEAESTLVLELRDSQTEELLARVHDRAAVEGVATMQDGAAITRWPDVEKLCRRWASTAQKRLDVLVSGQY